jgi:hypothetical protein
MLWLIWIAIILLTPVLAGIGIWYQTHTHAPDMNIAEMPNDSRPGHSS